MSIAGKRVNITFTAKLDGNRFYIPAKFRDIEIGTVIFYAFVPNDHSHDDLFSHTIIKGKVSKRRLVSIPSEMVPDSEVISVIIMEIFNPIKIKINQDFQGRITTRKTVLLPKKLFASTGDFVEGSVQQNISKELTFKNNRFFSSKVTKDGHITLPLENDEFDPKDRILFHIDTIIQSPENVIQKRKPTAIDTKWFCGRIVENPEIIYVSDPSIGLPHKVLKQMDYVKDNLNTSKEFTALTSHEDKYFLLLVWRFDGSEPYTHGFPFILVSFDPQQVDPSLMVHLMLNFKRDFLETLSHFHWNTQQIKSLARKFEEYIQETIKPKERNIISDIVPPLFTPMDLLDRNRFSSEEATIMSIIFSRMIDGKPLTHLEDLQGYDLQFDYRQCVNSLVTKGYLNQTLDENDDICYSISIFYFGHTKDYFSSQKAISMVIHSFGGGVAKTTLSVNLAKFLSEMGLKTVIIDFDFINSRLLEIFVPTGSYHYLNDYLENRATIEMILVPSQFNNIDVIYTDPRSDIRMIKGIDKEQNLKYFQALFAIL